MAGKALVNIKFAADLKQFSTQMQNANRGIAKMGKKLQNVGAALTVGVTAPLTAFGVASLKNWDKQVQAIAQVEAGLKATGNAVGFTSEQLQSMASDLQGTTLFGDEDILKNATAQLLTFTNIANNQFARTQQAALDLSTRLDGDLKSASIQLGKALNDPIANLSALSRSGIQFSDSQKATIKSLAETNRLADAQTLILDELEKQYGGSAAAAAKAGLGPLKQLSNAFGDVQESIGAILGEALLPLVDGLRGLVGRFQELSPETKKIIVVIGGVAAAIGPLLVVLGTLMTTVIPGLTTAFAGLSAAMLANPVGIIVTGVVALSAALVLANSRLSGLTDVSKELNAVNKEATKSIAAEKTELQRKLLVARDETKSQEERLAAIESLKKQYPKYLGFLDLESVNTDKAKKATDSLIGSLLQKAKVIAAQDKLVEVEKKLLDVQLGISDAADPSIWQLLGAKMKGFGSVAGEQIALSKSIAQNFKNEETALTSLKGKLTSYLSSNEDLVNSLKKTAEAANKVNTAVGGDPIEKRATATVGFEGANTADVDTEGFGALSFSETLDGEAGKVESTLDAMQNRFAAFSETNATIAGGLGDTFQNMGSSLVDSLNLASTGLEGFVKGLAQTVTKLIAMYLSQSLASSVAGATASGAATGPAAIFTTPGFIATAIGGVLSAFAAIPKFETGGIVGGNSYTGDKLLARINSGEMILNQRQQGNLANMLAPAGANTNVVLQPSLKYEGEGFRVMLNRLDKRRSKTV